MATRWPTVCLQWPTVRWFSLLDFLLKGLPVDTQDKVIQTYIVAIFSYIRIIFFEPYSFFTYNYSTLCTHRVFYFFVPQVHVLHNVVVCSECTELISLALTAVQCMTDIVVSTEENWR